MPKPTELSADQCRWRCDQAGFDFYLARVLGPGIETEVPATVVVSEGTPAGTYFVLAEVNYPVLRPQSRLALFGLLWFCSILLM